ncbi:MAG: PAS domain S-box protein, partial [Planctomycetaceae bacterium]|nr:PAS domain S-box protein [Planctomycetaceae bacterium]
MSTETSVHREIRFTEIICSPDGTIRDFAFGGQFPASDCELRPGEMLDESVFRVGDSLFDPVVAADRDSLQHRWKLCLVHGQSFECEVRVGRSRRDATWALLQVSADSAADEHDRRVTVAVIPIDRFVRQHLRLAERAQAVFDTAADAIITIDERGIIQAANKAVERLFGLTVEELIGQNVGVLMPDPYRSEHDGYIQRYLQTGEEKIIGVGRKVVARRKDGSEFPVHLSVSKFSLDDERHFTGIIRDLSDIEQVQQQLLQSERLAAIGQMVTGLAHESRNALQR